MNKKCYCEDGSEYDENHVALSIELSENGSRSELVVYCHDNYGSPREQYILINYCPWCGKKI